MPASMVAVGRARYAEQALERAIREDGGSQYVIIGGGMDSLVFGRTDLLDRIDVFEIDHSREQRKRRDRIRRAGLSVSPRHHFVSADLSVVSPVAALAASPFDPSRPAFFSLLGVVYYLTPKTLTGTARSTATNSPAGTRIGMDYQLDEASSDSRWNRARRGLLAPVDDRGEAMRSAWSISRINSLMTRKGFESIQNPSVAVLEPALREELGTLLFEIPGIFDLGMFRVARSEEPHRVGESHPSTDLRR